MWLRFGKEANWRSAEKAEKDFKLRASDEGLSLYRVSSRSEARLVTQVFGLVCKKSGPSDLFGILIPEPCLEPFTVEPRTYEDLPALLNDRHHEIPKAQLTPDAVTRLAKAVFQHGERDSVAVSEEQLCAAAIVHSKDKEILRFVSGQWLQRLGLKRQST